MAPTTVSRAQWGARAPRGTVATTTWSRRVGVAVHHSAGAASSSASAIRAIQNGDMDSDGFQDVGYNWMVTQDGRLWEGRAGGWLAIGAHAGGQNTAWVGVCWLGHSGNTAPSPAALATIRWVVDEARRRAGRQLEVRGHGQVPGQATECPGSRLRAWIAAGLPIEEDDVSARDVWGFDIRSESGATMTAAERLLDIETDVDKLRGLPSAVAQVRSMLATLAGKDPAAAVRAEFAKLTDTLVATVREAVPAANQDTVEAALREVLGSVDETS